MRTWCVSLTVHGTSKLVIRNFIVLLMYQRMTKACGTWISTPHVPWTPQLGHDLASGSSLSHTCRSPWQSWGSFMFRDPNAVQAMWAWISSKWKVTSQSFFVLFCFKKMSPTWIPKHFQHPTWKHWWMKSNHKSCMSVNSNIQPVWKQSPYLKAHARERDRTPRSFAYSDKVLRRIQLLLLPLKIKKY